MSFAGVIGFSPEGGKLPFMADRTRDDPETAEGRIWPLDS